jgi:hypothetical protein
LNVVRSRDEPARNFDPRSRGLALCDEAVSAIAFNLVELIAIDRNIAAGA